MTVRSVELDAPAKVNLRLRVLAQESSGYHSLETVFCALALADTLRCTRAAPGIELAVEGPVDTGPPADNLVTRAAERFYAELGEAPAVRLELRKRIPSAAGLGGGSSDAAATLRALNALHGEPFPMQALMQWGSELGSDVTFFLCGSPLALAWSRGERLLALPPLPARTVLVAHPGEPMPTRGAFQRIAELRGGAYQPRALALPLAALGAWESLAALAENDFQPVADERLPRLAEARRAMLEAGAEIALLAGSGASLFGVFPSAGACGVAAERVEGLGFATWRTESLQAPTAPRLGP